MLDKGMVAIQDRSAPMRESAPRRLGRLTLDVRQQLSPWKQAGFLAASLSVGLAISIAALAVAGIAPATLFE
jgi:general nucleoside transport system permease protein